MAGEILHGIKDEITGSEGPNQHGPADTVFSFLNAGFNIGAIGAVAGVAGGAGEALAGGLQNVEVVGGMAGGVNNIGEQPAQAPTLDPTLNASATNTMPQPGALMAPPSPSGMGGMG